MCILHVFGVNENLSFREIEIHKIVFADLLPRLDQIGLL